MYKTIIAATLLLVSAVSSKATVPYAVTTGVATHAEHIISSMDKFAPAATNGAEDVFVMSPMEMLAEDEGLAAINDDAEMLSRRDADFVSIQSELISTAKRYLGRPYVFGAKGPKAFDCSGFTGYVFRSNGYALGCDSRAQAVQGSHVSFDEVEPGDLIFFSGRGGGSRVGHVGIVAEVDPASGSMTFIHASTKRGVVMQKYPDGGYYSKHFLKFRRVIDDETIMARK